MLRIIKSPAQYAQAPGSLGDLGTYYSQLGAEGAYVIVDPFVADNYKEEILGGLKDFKVTLEVFHGECSIGEVNRNIDLMKASGCDVVIGIGGGKTLDTAKAVAYYTKLPVMIVPTIASTDAPCSALTVLYTDSGEFDKYLFLRANPNMVIVDPDVIVKAPVRLLVAGMGDALATYFEAKACADSNADTTVGGKSSKAGLALAELCFNTLLEDGYKAKLAAEKQVCTEAVENIIEANTYLSGIGFESGGLAAAHAIHNGFTVLEECHHMYHGEKVAFGTIVQLVLENRPMEEIEEIILFCMEIGLPTTLEDIGAGKVTPEQLMEVAKASTVEGETIHNLVKTVTAQDVYAAIITADSIGHSMK